MEDRTEFETLVGIEIDPSRLKSNGGPRLLNQADAEQMLSHLAADLGGLLPRIRKCRLLAMGALYEQCQILRPGLPVFHALSSHIEDRERREATPGLTALGAHQGQASEAKLQPDATIPPGILLLLPLLLEGPASIINQLREEMEHRFLSEGQVSAHTASWLEAAFNITIAHARFMTLTDLNAMFHLQLENFGFLPLWQLIDGAINGDDMEVSTDQGNAFRLHDGEVVARFESFDYWALSGAGREVDVARDQLAKAYADRTLEFRQYVSTLDAHRVPIQFEARTHGNLTLEGSFICEQGMHIASAGMASVTEHSWPDVGTIAITAVTPDGMKHFYPLNPGGLNDIHAALGNLELDGEGISYTGRVDYDPEKRRLVAAAMESA